MEKGVPILLALTVTFAMMFPPISKFPPPPAAPAGIQYGAYRFSEPYQFPPVLMAPIQGVYAIMVKDSQMKPRPFRLLYIGESANLQQRLTTQHEKYNHWAREAGGLILHYAYHMTIGWTEKQRKDMEADLISQYNPPCNTMLRSIVFPPMPAPKNLW